MIIGERTKFCKNLDNSFVSTIIVSSVVFVASFVILFLMMDRTLNIYDEGVILTGAMRISAGDIIHRDFYANYGPAPFYIVSWLFELFGQHVGVERIFDLSVRAGFLVLVYNILSSYCRYWITFSSVIVCTIWLSTVGNHGYPIYPTLLLTVASTLMCSRADSLGKSSFYMLIAGLLTGFSAFFRYDIGFLAAVANIISGVMILFFESKNLESFYQAIFRKVGPYVIGAGAPVFLLILVYWSSDILTHFVYNVVLFPGEFYARTRALPFPGPSSIFHGSGLILVGIYLPIFICFATLLLFFGKKNIFFKFSDKSAAGEFTINSHDKFIISFTTLVAIFYLKGVVRVSIEHMQLSLLPAVMLLAVQYQTIGKMKSINRVILMFLIFMSSLAASSSVYNKVALNQNLVFKDVRKFILTFANVQMGLGNEVGAYENIITIDKTPLFYIDKYRELAIRYILKNTLPGDRIFVGLEGHDKVFISDISAYFLTSRLPVTKWHQFDPGLQTSVEIQGEIIRDLEENKVEYVWIENTWRKIIEPNDSSVSSRVTLLDEYLFGNYQLAIKFESISILKRKLSN